MLDHHPRALSGKRDLRIDFFRGVALYMILVDHVVGDPISKFTYQRVGFSDAAELFVFLSGVSCAIVYSRVLERRGWAGLLTSIARRTTKIYAFYLVTCAAVILLISAAAGSPVTASFLDNPFASFDGDVRSALWSAVLLTSPPALPGILVLYLMLTLFVIPLFLLGAKRSPALTLAASGVVWAAAQLFPDLAPHLATRSYFNWLSWQFLFSIGMFVGMRRGIGAPLVPSQQRYVLGCAWAIVIATLGYRMLVFVGPKAGLNVDWLHLSEVTVAHMKENLSALRLVHFLSVALLVGTYLKSNNSFFANAAAQAVIQTGRHSLEVFCLSAVCSVVLNILVILEHPFTLQRLVLDFTAILLNLMLVVALTQRQVSASSRKLATSSPSAAR